MAPKQISFVDLSDVKLLEEVRKDVSLYTLALSLRSADLPTLDAQLSEELPSRTKEGLTQVLRWKMQRGKFRPTLNKLLDSNTEKDVENAIAAALSEFAETEESDDQVSKAIQCLSKLKGIGPATASACLAFFKPEQVLFFSDELALTLFPKSPIKYTLPYYKQVVQEAKRQVAELGDGWTLSNFERAVWTITVLKREGRGDALSISDDATTTPAPAKHPSPPVDDANLPRPKRRRASPSTPTKASTRRKSDQ